MANTPASSWRKCDVYVNLIPELSTRPANKQKWKYEKQIWWPYTILAVLFRSKVSFLALNYYKIIWLSNVFWLILMKVFQCKLKAQVDDKIYLTWYIHLSQMQQFNSTYLTLTRGYYNEPLKCRQILSHFHQVVNQYDQENGTARTKNKYTS